MLALLERLGIKTFPQHTAGRTLMQLGQEAPVVFLGTIPRLGPMELINLQCVQWLINYHMSGINKVAASPSDRRAVPRFISAIAGGCRSMWSCHGARPSSTNTLSPARLPELEGKEKKKKKRKTDKESRKSKRASKQIAFQ